VDEGVAVALGTTTVRDHVHAYFSTRRGWWRGVIQGEFLPKFIHAIGLIECWGF
jgi:hypothetical protein